MVCLVGCKISSKTPLHPDAYIPIYPHIHPTFPILPNIFKIYRSKPQENQKFLPSIKYILIFGMLRNLLYIQHMYLSPTKLKPIYYV